MWFAWYRVLVLVCLREEAITCSGTSTASRLVSYYAYEYTVVVQGNFRQQLGSPPYIYIHA